VQNSNGQKEVNALPVECGKIASMIVRLQRNSRASIQMQYIATNRTPDNYMLKQTRASLAMRVQNEHANRISENQCTRKEGRKEGRKGFLFFFPLVLNEEKN
jgi:hypothetical protein